MKVSRRWTSGWLEERKIDAVPAYHKIYCSNVLLIERIFQFEVDRIHFENLLMHNDREMESNETELAFIMLDFINCQITWLRQNI